jgi:hypothetical protein
MAPFISGYVLGYMVSDNETHKKFQKYKPVVIPHARDYNFYVYTHSEESYKNCVDVLEKNNTSAINADLRA